MSHLILRGDPASYTGFIEKSVLKLKAGGFVNSTALATLSSIRTETNCRILDAVHEKKQTRTQGKTAGNSQSKELGAKLAVPRSEPQTSASLCSVLNHLRLDGYTRVAIGPETR